MSSDLWKFPSGFSRPNLGNATPVSGRKVLLIQKENRTQTHFRIGNMASYDRSSPDYYALLVANTYLGQHRESFPRLFKEIRAERGLAYRACSYAEHFEQIGWTKLPHPLIPWNPTYYSMWSFPKASNAEFTIKLAMLEFSNLIEHRIGPGDLDRMKRFSMNHFAFLHETPAKRLGLELEQIYFRDSTYIEQYPERVSRVTAAEASAAVRERWSADNWLLVAVVSDAEQFKAELLDGKTVVEYPPGTSNIDLETRDEQVRRYDLKLSADDITIVEASELFR
jgi:zinc protease